MSTVLLIVILSLVLLGLLKIGDAFRDLAFEVRLVRAAIEHQTEKQEELHQSWWGWGQRDPAERAEAGRRNAPPTCEEIMEEVG